MTKSEENDTSSTEPENKKEAVRRTLLTGIAFITGFVILGVIAIQVWEYSNSVSFCANTCHDVHPEEIAAFRDSFHANVKCTECHMGRVGTIRSMFLKAGHFRHLPAVIFDQYDRPLESETMRPANESCELCHWPPAFHGDTVREIVRFLPDEENTEKRTYLILKTGAGAREQGLGYGIHWHVTAPVEYIATDEHGEVISWVRTTLPNGQTVEYQDVTHPLSPEEIAQADKKVMDCVDCHNRVGHPFLPPEDLVDRALAEEQVSPDLPYAKKSMMDLLTAPYESREAALAAVDGVKEQYEAQYPEVAAANPGHLDEAQQVAKELVTRLVFEEPGITWEDFQDHGRHKEFAGCFRCHDGKHLAEDGESIRLHCNICHSVPVTVGEGDRVPQLPVASIQEPSSHLATNFIADHRFQATSACEGCHGQVDFGRDDSSFCANSACHGRAWPQVALDAAFPHPIPLEGKHAEVWCHDCHEGARKPEFFCANCHEPPADPHFGSHCEDCHTPAGFSGATLPPELHPVPLEGAHAKADCEACHAGVEGDLDYVCANCHEPPEHHLAGSCDTCHSPEGFVESASFLVGLAPEIPHDVEGRDDCLLCHDPTGDIKPAPANHTEYANGQCTLCHKSESQ